MQNAPSKLQNQIRFVLPLPPQFSSIRFSNCQFLLSIFAALTAMTSRLETLTPATLQLLISRSPNSRGLWQRGDQGGEGGLCMEERRGVQGICMWGVGGLLQNMQNILPTNFIYLDFSSNYSNLELYLQQLIIFNFSFFEQRNKF